MDWYNIFWGTENFIFLVEIAIRSVIMFFLLFTALRITGKRAVKQLSIFELIIIIALGSAAGDPMIYKEIGIVYALVVFIIVFLSYWLITKLIENSEKMEKILEGKPYCIIDQGKASKESLKHKELAMDEFFSILRHEHIFHLGQVESAILETSGELSILFYDSSDIKAGLPIWPHYLKKKTKQIEYSATYACTYCGYTKTMKAGESNICEYCNNNNEWVEAKTGNREK
ncbi:DUF421 domain-containing protein [Dysgonomonas sp. Marseille-P4677]|uniref:DUF421 domain-containing protein n=1 Tax=Dysgonomonas sp. Marseille-P4677 TaxID=2364790 RepID=UPI001912B87B|nr:YetF domain-containing protein [Dysgonomonas sp. Marseille-P4677]MBK5720964.1 DUF421 domain-containing protein [Dysgonomonas sp. Marseille-P4677]